jgi:hypothetical protein
MLVGQEAVTLVLRYWQFNFPEVSNLREVPNLAKGD